MNIFLDWKNGSWCLQGTLEINPTRVLAEKLDYFEAGTDPRFTPIDLSVGEGGRDGPEYPTLDGNDNVIPPHLVSRALRCNWAALTGRLLELVVEIFEDAIGTAYDLDSYDTRDAPAIRLPPLDRWVPKEIETYFELQNENALSCVQEFADLGSSIAANFVRDEFERPFAYTQIRERNAVVARFGLGATGIQLCLYAKTRDRVRLEVRYKKTPLKGASIRRDEFAGTDRQFWPLVLEQFATNAQRRLIRFIAAYSAVQGGAEPRRHRMAMLLAHIARASNGDPRLTQDVINLLLAHGGIGRSADPALNSALDFLHRHDVLRITSSVLRSRQVEYAISPFYAQSLNLLRHLTPLG